jgi:hypothetical protein
MALIVSSEGFADFGKRIRLVAQGAPSREGAISEEAVPTLRDGA